MLYTVMPMEIIFKSEMDEQLKYEEVEINGCYLQVINKDSEYVVNRIISTDPKSYLNPLYQPGSIINRNLLKK